MTSEPTPIRGATVRGLATALSDRLGALPSLIVADELESTQTFARRLLDRHFADDEVPGAFAVLALGQTAGRGRRGRSWSSGTGLGVWGSLALPVSGSDALQALPLRAAVALAETLNGWLGGSCRVKWPNDLVCDGRKLGGLLVDAIAGPSGVGWAIVGVGVNHGHRSEELPEPKAVSLTAAGGDTPPLAEVVAGIFEALWTHLTAERGWLERYRALTVHEPGERIECEIGTGERVIGHFAGFDDLGRIRIETADEVRTLTSGEVFS